MTRVKTHGVIKSVSLCSDCQRCVKAAVHTNPFLLQDKISLTELYPSAQSTPLPVVFILPDPGRFLCCSSSLSVRRWFSRMWRLFCHVSVLISSSLPASGRFCLMIVEFRGYLHLCCLLQEDSLRWSYHLFQYMYQIT